MEGLREEAGPIDSAPYTWVCRYYRHLHPGEDRDPCTEIGTREVLLGSTGDVFAICDEHYTEYAETHKLEVIRDL